jgi:4-hydroxy-tetrahydrodipicolinate synthase
MYLLELLPAGICGVMPGLAMVDLFQSMVRNLREHDAVLGAGIFERILPFVVYSLQNMELFHHCEKLLLVRRGVLRSANVREAGLTLDSSARAYLDFLFGRILECAGTATALT